MRVIIRAALLRESRFETTNPSRRGVSLVLVLIAVSMSLMLTYASLSSQSRGLQVKQNVNRQESARRAAESGAAIALAKIQASDWSGVSTKLSGTLESDSSGTSSYSVEFLTIDAQVSPTAYPTGQGKTVLSWGTSIFNTSATGLTTASAIASASATKQAFQMLIRSTGKWQSATVSTDLTADVVEVGVELQPRVPGRTILAGDSSTATDVLPSTADYDKIQTYALFTSIGSSLNASVQVDPGHRIDGDCWSNRGVDVFTGPLWASTQRNQFLQDVGNLYSTTTTQGTTLRFPHPFGGSITNVYALTSAEQADLTKLNVPRQQVSATLALPTLSFSAWRQYQLFQGSFTYDAEVLTSGSLDGDVLRPTLRNPLGVFYREGDLTIDDNVVIQGTLVCSGRVTFTGNNVLLSSVNWRDASGLTLLPSADLFPRPPAIVAGGVSLGRDVRVTIEGAVLSAMSWIGSDSNYELLSATNVDLSGSQATCSPIRTPYSEVQIPTGIDLSTIASNGLHAIWLADGNSGDWYPIASIDVTNRRLTVVGETRRSGPVIFRIKRNRLRHADVRGPVMVTRLRLTAGNAWELGSSLWSSRYSLWQWIVSLQQAQGQATTPWVTYVADPNNYPGWGAPYDTVGLPLEPTFHLRPLSGGKYRDSLPLFRGYVPPANDLTGANFAGLRWRVLFWRTP